MAFSTHRGFSTKLQPLPLSTRRVSSTRKTASATASVTGASPAKRQSGRVWLTRSQCEPLVSCITNGVIFLKIWIDFIALSIKLSPVKFERQSEAEGQLVLPELQGCFQTHRNFASRRHRSHWWGYSRWARRPMRQGAHPAAGDALRVHCFCVLDGLECLVVARGPECALAGRRVGAQVTLSWVVQYYFCY